MIQIINVSTPDDHQGDTLRDSMVKVNNNFAELQAQFGDYETADEYQTIFNSIEADLSSLQTQINGKAPLVHTHLISQIVGLQYALSQLVPVAQYNLNQQHLNTQISEINQQISDLLIELHQTANDVTDLQEEQVVQNQQIASLQAEQVVQNNQISVIQAEQVVQNNDINALEAEQVVQNNQISVIQAEQVVQNQQIVSLQAEQVVQNNAISALQQTDLNLQNQIDDINTSIDNIDSDIDGLELDIVNLQAVDGDLQEQIDSIEAEQLVQNDEIDALQEQINNLPVPTLQSVLDAGNYSVNENSSATILGGSANDRFVYMEMADENYSKYSVLYLNKFNANLWNSSATNLGEVNVTNGIPDISSFNLLSGGSVKLNVVPPSSNADLIFNFPIDKITGDYTIATLEDTNLQSVLEIGNSATIGMVIEFPVGQEGQDGFRTNGYIRSQNLFTGFAYAQLLNGPISLGGNSTDFSRNNGLIMGGRKIFYGDSDGVPVPNTFTGREIPDTNYVQSLIQSAGTLQAVTTLGNTTNQPIVSTLAVGYALDAQASIRTTGFSYANTFEGIRVLFGGGGDAPALTSSLGQVDVNVGLKYLASAQTDFNGREIPDTNYVQSLIGNAIVASGSTQDLQSVLDNGTFAVQENGVFITRVNIGIDDNGEGVNRFSVSSPENGRLSSFNQEADGNRLSNFETTTESTKRINFDMINGVFNYQVEETPSGETNGFSYSMTLPKANIETNRAINQPYFIPLKVNDVIADESGSIRLNYEDFGRAVINGDGVTDSFDIPHTINSPNEVIVVCSVESNEDDQKFVSFADENNVIVKFPNGAPVVGVTLILNWIAKSKA